MTDLADPRRAPAGNGETQSVRRWLARAVGPVVALANWFAAACGLAAAIVRQGVRPVTWRRSVRAEFFRFLDLASVQSVPSVVVAGGLVGFTVIAEYTFWLRHVGRIQEIDEVLLIVIVRDIAPLLVGLLVLGRSGLVLLGEVGRMRREGEFRTLDAQGIDPFLTIIVPRVLAITLSVFSLTIVFILAVVSMGHVTAVAIEYSSVTALEVVIQLLETIGSAGGVTIPVKTLAIGFTIGVVCSLTALETKGQESRAANLMPKGFVRSVLAIFLVSSLTSLVP